MVSVKYFVLIFCCCLLPGLHTTHAAPAVETQTEIIRVAVASNFKPVLAQLISEYKKQNSASQIQISSASSGVLYAQILRGAPFDLFLSADSLRPILLEEQGLIRINSRRIYARGKLVLWSMGQPIQGISDLHNYSGKIAIANPELAPFGRASQQVLSVLELWPANKNKLVMANNVLQVANMLYSGAVDIGMVSASQVKNVQKHQLWFVPEELYSPIEQQIVILNQTNSESRHLQKVQSFYHYILSAMGQQIIANSGYAVTNNSMVSTGQADD